MRLKKLITFSLVLVLVLIGAAIFLYNYNFSDKINVERTAVIFTLNNPASAKSTLIKVNGTFYKPIFRQKKFIGNFIIDGYDFTKDQKVTLYITKRNNGINMSSLFYLDSSPPYNIKQNGMIWFDDKFENINIWPSGNWIEVERETLAFITTGSTYEEASKTQIMMRKKFGNNMWFVPHEYDSEAKRE